MTTIRISQVHLENYVPSTYTKPLTVDFVQNDTHRTVELFTKREGVIIIIYNTSRKVLVFVKQIRPPVFIHDVPEEDRRPGDLIDLHKYPPENAQTLEFCAGLVDKCAALEQIAREEVAEECGYDVPVDKLEKVCTFTEGVHPSGDLHYLYYCEVTDDMKIEAEDADIINVVELSVVEVEKYCLDGKNVPTAPLLFGVFWFLNQKYGKNVTLQHK